MVEAWIVQLASPGFCGFTWTRGHGWALDLKPTLLLRDREVVSREAHNLQVAGSTPASAISDLEMLRLMVCENAPSGVACMDSFGPYPPCGQGKKCNSCIARELAGKYLEGEDAV